MITTFKDLNNENLLELTLNIADCVLVRNDYTIESLNLIKFGRDLLYEPEKEFNIQYKNDIIFHENKTINKAILNLHEAIHYYKFNNYKKYKEYIEYSLESFAKLLYDKFTEEKLINTFLTLINTTQKILEGGKKGYIINNFSGRIITKYHYFKEFIENNNYFRYYNENNTIVIKTNIFKSFTIRLNEIYSIDDFQEIIKYIKYAKNDYYNCLYELRIKSLSWNGKQKTFII
jgi:hypothetical protein